MSTRPIRVLHVVGGLARGGTETWLRNVYLRTDRSHVEMSFVVHGDVRGEYEAELVAAGARIYRCPSPSEVRRYARSLLDLLRREGPFDIVHSHVHHFSGVVLALAARANVAAEDRAQPPRASCG